MASLDNLPEVDPPFRNRGAVPGDRGPNWIDAETVERLGQQIAGGVISFPQNPGAIVAGTSDNELQALFAKHLAASPLSTPFPLLHRVYALTQAILALLAAAQAGATLTGGPLHPTLGQIEIAAGNLETWLLGAAASDALPEQFTDEERAFLARTTSMLDASTVAALTGFSLNTLATWRMSHVGPPYVKMSNQRRSIRYPVAGVLGWINAMVQA